MPGPWFLLLIFAQVGNLMIEEVSTIDIWDESPSCEELRTMWNSISRSVRTSQFTNEIPLLPYWDITSSSIKGHHHRDMDRGGRKQIRYLENPMVTNAIQGTFMEEGLPSSHPHIFPPVEPLFVLGPQRKTLRHNVLSGHFGDFGDDKSEAEEDIFLNMPAAVTSLGTRKKGGNENVLSESWGLPEEVGMFGKFVDFDAEYPVTSDRQSPGLFRSPSLEVNQEPCFQVLNKDCTANEQCLCSGWNALQCFHGKCSSQQLKTETEREHGSWHDGPLPRSKLGRQKRLRRNRESTFM